MSLRLPSRPAALRRVLAPLAALLLAAALVAGVAAAGSYALAPKSPSWSERLTGGDRDRAPALITANGCGGCHTIPGVPGARGTVGPALAGLDERSYIAGILPNTPENLVRWIIRARDIDPGTAMPNTLVSDQDARDIAAFLYGAR